jgi:hypothetical protein
LLGPEPGVCEFPLDGLDIDPGGEVSGDRVRRLINVSLGMRVWIYLRHDDTYDDWLVVNGTTSTRPSRWREFEGLHAFP